MTVWITRKNLHVDRTACPWLIRRFIDPRSRFLFVDPNGKRRPEGRTFDMIDAEFGHVGPKCTFEVMVDKFGLRSDPALVEMGAIVRGADMATSARKRPESFGLEAVISGIQATVEDDEAKLRVTHPVYEALYAYCQQKMRGHRSRDPRRPTLRVARRIREHLAE
jgi:hypothetical protein